LRAHLLGPEEEQLDVAHEARDLGVLLVALLRGHERLLVRAELLLDLGLDRLRNGGSVA